MRAHNTTIVLLAQSTILETLQSKAESIMDTPLHECVLARYREYVATGKYPYLNAVQDFIIEKEALALAEAQREILHTQVYVAADFCRREAAQKHIEQMEADGWKLLRSVEEAVEICKRGKKIRAILTATVDWLTTRKEIVLRPIITSDNRPFFMPPRASRRGYYADRFLMGGGDTCFYRED